MRAGPAYAPYLYPERHTWWRRNRHILAIFGCVLLVMLLAASAHVMLEWGPKMLHYWKTADGDVNRLELYLFGQGPINATIYDFRLWVEGEPPAEWRPAGGPIITLQPLDTMAVEMVRMEGTGPPFFPEGVGCQYSYRYNGILWTGVVYSKEPDPEPGAEKTAK